MNGTFKSASGEMRCKACQLGQDMCFCGRRSEVRPAIRDWIKGKSPHHDR